MEGARMSEQGLFGISLDQFTESSDQPKESRAAAKLSAHRKEPEEKRSADHRRTHDGKPKRYTGILRKPLPPSASPKHDRELQRRYEALCRFHDVEPRDYMGLLAAMMVHHVPGFKPSPPEPDLTGYSRLALALAGLHKKPRGNQKKPIYNRILPHVIEFVKEKKASTSMIRIKICEMYILKERKEYKRFCPDEESTPYDDLSAQTLA
jgi:hypothetical protein